MEQRKSFGRIDGIILLDHHALSADVYWDRPLNAFYVKRACLDGREIDDAQANQLIRNVDMRPYV